MGYCLRHMEEPSTASCRSCNGSYCARCLVFAFGPKKPPYCVGCALHVSGVRPGSRKVSFNPVAQEPNGFGEPVAFGTVPHDDSDEPAPPPPGGGRRRLSRGERKAARQADKAAHDHGVPAASGALPGPAPVEELEPVLSPSQQRTLGRLTAGALAQS